MQAGENLRKDSGTSLNIVLKANFMDKRKNPPTSNEIAFLMKENNQTNLNQRDIVITKRNGEKSHLYQVVNENLSLYDPLAFPIIHLYGEPGLQFSTYPKITLSNDDPENVENQSGSVTKQKYVTARDFYAYRLQDRPGTFKIIRIIQ